MSGIVCSQALPCPTEENVVVVDELVPSQEILMDRILIYLLTHITETSEKNQRLTSVRPTLWKRH